VSQQVKVYRELQFLGAGTGVHNIVLVTALADALSIKDSAADLIVFDTSTPKITITPATTITGAATLSSTLALSGAMTAADNLTMTAGKFLIGSPPKMTITAKTANATLTAAEAGIVTSTDGKTMTLPAASGNSGLRYIIKAIATHSDGVIVDANASETIDGATTKTSPAQYAVLDIVCNGTGWHVINSIGTWT